MRPQNTDTCVARVRDELLLRNRNSEPFFEAEVPRLAETCHETSGCFLSGERLADPAVVACSDYIPRLQEVQAPLYHVLRGLVGRCKA